MVRRSILAVALVIAFSAAAASTQAFADDPSTVADGGAVAIAQALSLAGGAPAP